MSSTTFYANKHTPTHIDFKVTGTCDQTTQTFLIIEDVISGCDISIKGTLKENGVWTVTIPSISNFTSDSYNTRLEVVADGKLTCPVVGKIVFDPLPTVEFVAEQQTTGGGLIEEGVNSGTVSASGPETPLDTAPQDPEFPIDNDTEGDERAHGTAPYTPGENATEHIDPDALDDEQGSDETDCDDHTTIDDIASHVNGAAGPQLQMYEPKLDLQPDIEPEAVFDPKVAAQRIIRQLLPSIKLKTESTARLLSDVDRRRILKDPTLVAEMEQKARKVRSILG